MNDSEASLLPWQADTLARALMLRQQDRLPHAVMIDSSGEADLGEFAHNLSMLLLCQQSNDLKPCGDCKACRMLVAGTHADFNVVTLEQGEKSSSKNIKIEQIRHLTHELSLTPQYQSLKIAIIYPAETMTIACANALLKTLEEPSPRTLLILLTRNRGRIPVTLRSRCQAWSIKLPAWDSAVAWLLERGFEEPSAARYLAYAGGDPVLAINLKHQDYGALVKRFKTRFGEFMRGENSASSLCAELLKFEAGLLRRLFNMILSAYCYQMSGLDADTLTSNPRGDRDKARELLDLRLRAQSQLATQENNLDLQLQLEDVLISLKHILTRRLI